MFTRALHSQRQWVPRQLGGPSTVRFNSQYQAMTAIFNDAGKQPTAPAKSADPSMTAGPKVDAVKIRVRELVRQRFIKPTDLTFENRTKLPHPRKRPLLGPSAKESRKRDVFHQFNIDPLHESFNSSLLSHFVTEMGKIKGRAETGLTWKSQRRLGKAIRRAKMMGIIPILSRRPLFQS